MKKILLMTGTIRPQCQITHNNVQIRAKEYQTNIERYIKYSSFDIIIFAENSGYKINVAKYEKEAAEVGKIFEYLDLSDMAQGNNISVGDALIIRSAIEKSKYIIGENNIWKVSGRIYIRNVNKILKKTENSTNNIFLYSRKYDSIQTWFFRARVNDLEKFFLTQESIEKMEESCIEYIFMDVYRKNSNNILIQRFNPYPDAEGINSSGQPYTTLKWKLVLKNVYLKIGRFDVK